MREDEDREDFLSIDFGYRRRRRAARA